MKTATRALLLISTFLPVIAYTDVGVIGGSGNMILYYQENNLITRTECSDNTFLGATPAEARANCEGVTNKVPAKSFKQTLRNLVSTDKLKVLKPLTKQELEAYRSGSGPTADKVKKMVAELEKINAFIANYGEENANLIRRDELVKALGSSKLMVNATKKIQKEIDSAVSLIANQTKLTLSKFSTNKEMFLYQVLKNFDPSEKLPCGFKGSVDERINDCSDQQSSVKDGWSLVTRTKEFKEVWKDLKSGMLWGDRLPSLMNHHDAQKACNASLAEVGKLEGKAWRLPSIEEYKDANSHGIRSALPNMRFWWWSSSVHSDNSNVAWLFDGNNGLVAYAYRNYDSSVRCVAPAE